MSIVGSLVSTKSLRDIVHATAQQLIPMKHLHKLLNFLQKAMENFLSARRQYAMDKHSQATNIWHAEIFEV